MTEFMFVFRHGSYSQDKLGIGQEILFKLKKNQEKSEIVIIYVIYFFGAQ